MTAVSVIRSLKQYFLPLLVKGAYIYCFFFYIIHTATQAEEKEGDAEGDIKGKEGGKKQKKGLAGGKAETNGQAEAAAGGRPKRLRVAPKRLDELCN